jgi:hypothetical protein
MCPEAGILWLFAETCLKKMIVKGVSNLYAQLLHHHK